MRRRTRIATTLALAIGLVAGGSAGANTVTIDETVVSGNTATVTGTASFPAITTAQPVGGTKTPFTAATAAAGTAAGLDLVSGTITPISGGLRFTWNVSSMPEQGVLPEGTRYTWSFSIGETQYQLQAKRSNIASVTTTEDPVGHAQHLTSQQHWFQLRGACETSYQGLPLSGCYHLAFLNGGVDVAGKRAWIDLPFETKDKIGRIVAPDFKPGAVLTPLLTAGASIAGSFQVVATYNNAPAGNISGFMSSYINEWGPYYIGGRVQVAVANHTADQTSLGYGAPLTLTGGAFSTTVTGLNATNNTVYIRACNGVNCTYASKRLIGA